MAWWIGLRAEKEVAQLFAVWDISEYVYLPSWQKQNSKKIQKHMLLL